MRVARVNPCQARDFARATGELAKTDTIDASLLALMAKLFADRLRPHVAAPPWQRDLRAWLRRRGPVVTVLQMQKQQAAMAPAAVKVLLTRTIAALKRELAAIYREMQTLLRQHATPAPAQGRSASARACGVGGAEPVLELGFCGRRAV